jgi:hypothetical protein
MAAGLGFKEFTTGDVLTAADANGYLASQVVMVFANAAARTSAITSPQEGMISFLKDTNSTEYYSGTAWVPIASAATGGLTLVKKVDFTASSSVDLSNSFSSTYVNYLLIGNWTGTADNDVLYRYRVSGADDSTSNYNIQLFDVDGISITGTRLATGTNGRLGATRASGSRVTNSTWFNSPFLAQTKASQATNATTTTTTIAQNGLQTGFNAATSFTGLTVYPGAGTITGTISIYGLPNS